MIMSIEEIINFAAVRRDLFENAVGPATVITFTPQVGVGEKFTYIVPKSGKKGDRGFRISIDPHDVHSIFPQEVLSNSSICTALMWGGRRDNLLLNKLCGLSNLLKLEAGGVIISRRGIVRGNRRKQQPTILGRRILDDNDFPSADGMVFWAKDFPINDDPFTHSKDSTDFAAFQSPQLLIKRTWRKINRRFRSVFVESSADDDDGVICDDSYVSVHARNSNTLLLKNYCIAINSIIAVYHQLFCTSQFATFNQASNAKDLLGIPLMPEIYSNAGQITKVSDISNDTIFDLYNITTPERALIEDAVNYTLADIMDGNDSASRKPTIRGDGDGDTETYCRWFIRVMKAAFGNHQPICATVFQEDSGCQQLPVRMVAIHLDWPDRAELTMENLGHSALLDHLQKVQALMKTGKENGFGYIRVIRAYDVIIIGESRIPTFYIIKPDMARYWTRSLAMREADEFCQYIVLWRNDGGNSVEQSQQ